MLQAGQEYFAKLMSEANGDMAKAAQLAGLARTTMYKILPKYGIAVEKSATVRQVEPQRKYPAALSNTRASPLGFNERKWLK